MMELLQSWQSGAATLAFFALFGAVAGSFANLVIWRWPRRMQEEEALYFQQWQQNQAPGQSGLPSAPQDVQAPAARWRWYLFWPRSMCSSCEKPLGWRDLTPVLSFIWLRARCRLCGARLSVREPLVELLLALGFVAMWFLHGSWAAALFWCLFLVLLVISALIDWDTTYLPDEFTLLLLWVGLLAASFGFSRITLQSAVLGAVTGYLSLWVIYWLHRAARRREGIGFGDFKLFAALGAWLGWQVLAPLLLLASASGLIAGLIMRLRGQLREGVYVPFGPFLALAGALAAFAVYYPGAGGSALRQFFMLTMGSIPRGA